MALRANAEMEFDRYRLDDAGVVLHFTCADPGAGESCEYEVLVTDAELASVSTMQQFGNLVTAKLTRRYRANTQLDGLIGRSVTI